jgi:prepilin-type N-terminal cleavage/methylation domain-containing protein
MKRRGFTLVELLVVIAIIALLMGILMPALARVRQLAFRMTCGTNLSGIGKAMLLYANDYQDELPKAGGRNGTWGTVPQWANLNRVQAFGTAADGSGGTATISSCFYLLVKFTEVTPKSFICKGDSGTNEFKVNDWAAGSELVDVWDFGPGTGTPPENTKHCSYAYHFPFGMYALTVSSEPAFAVAADRNPFLPSPAGAATPIGSFTPDLPAYPGGNSDKAKAGNCLAHQLDGQNVMFLDTHVSFEKRAYCSVEDDNIYLVSDKALTGSPFGAVPVFPMTNVIQNRKDTVLVHDPDNMSTGGTSTATRTTRSS